MSAAPLRVLVVDDDDALRSACVSYLGGHDGISIVGQAANGAAGIAEAERLGPDVVVIDLHMPELDGLAATRAIKSSSPETKVILLTSDERDTVAESGREAGADHVVRKLIFGAELLECVRARPRG